MALAKTTEYLVADDNMERLAASARRAGCPRDQVENFLTAGYIPLEGYLPFHAAARRADEAGGPEWLAAGGKRGPGKSHAGFSQVLLDDCQRVEGIKALVLRKYQKTAVESTDDFVRKLLKYTRHKYTAQGVEFDNGSRAVIGGYKDAKDIEKYLGLEYDVMLIEEATQFAEDKRDRIRGSLRTNKPNWRPRIYLTTNAEGIGLAWFKRDFVEPARKRVAGNTFFLDVSHIYNPFINIEYTQWLASLTGKNPILAKAWDEGDWDAFAGMAHPLFSRDRHVIPLSETFEIPDPWPKWRATDWGYASPFATGWATKNPDTHRIYIYREAYQAMLTDRQQARMIRDYTPPGEQIAITYADPSIWERKNRQGEVYTTVDEYRAEGVILTKADNDRKGGYRKINNALADLPDGQPGLMFFENCTHIIEQMSTLAIKEGQEDIADDQEDHAWDYLRYLLTNERRLVPPPKPQQRGDPMVQMFRMDR